MKAFVSYSMVYFLCVALGALSAEEAYQSTPPFSVVKELVPTPFTPQFQKLLDSGEYTEAIQALQEEIAAKEDAEKAPLYVLLAVIYMRDQKEEESFKAFLEALRLCPEKQSYVVNPEDLKVYNQFLPLYIEQSKYPASQAAKELEVKLSPIAKSHPEYVEVRFLLAAAKANLHHYEEFFSHFFSAYKEDKNSFLAARTVAILHVKLFEKARLPEEKEAERKEIQEAGKRALEKNAQDVQMYKLLVLFSTPELKRETLCEMILAIIKNNVQIPRSDIPFYVNELVTFHKYDLALSFLDTQEKLYQYSRIIDEMRKAVIDDKNRSSGK